MTQLTKDSNSDVKFVLNLGFEEAGKWVLVDGLLKCELNKHEAETNVLYAFTANDQILYIGKSVRTLTMRMCGYQKPGPTQRTNIVNNEKLKQLLSQVQYVQILAFVAKETVYYRGVPLNVAAGLEDWLIRHLRPPWNRIGVCT
jgi:hypothetical protein